MEQMWYWGDGPDGWGVFWMSVMMAAMWIPLLIVIVWLLRGFTRPSGHEPPMAPGGSPEPDARELVRRAYARGQIDREHYLQVIDDLERTGEKGAR